MNEDEVVSWVNMPRYIREMFHEGFLDRLEYFVCLHLRMKMDMYGKCTTSFAEIRDDLNIGFGEGGINQVNAIFLKLKKRRLIWYEKRQGKRGSFIVRHHDAFLPGGHMTSLNKYFNHGSLASNTATTQTDTSPEVSPEVGDVTTHLGWPKRQVNPRPNSIDLNSMSERHNNDKDNDKKRKAIIDTQTPSFKERDPEEGSQIPKSDEREFLQKIATKLGEPNTNWLCSRCRLYGFKFVRGVWQEFQQEPKNNIDSMGAFFNTFLERRATQIGNSKSSGVTIIS